MRGALSVIAWMALALVAGCGATPPDRPGLFVFGVDGMDPVILQRLMAEGKMPNFSKLAAEGSFQPLATANPPQSPVAWSTFVTGRNPGGHGVFDFVHRDPKTYMPVSSSTPPAEPGTALELFGYYLPVGGETPGNTRGGTPFWDALHAAGVPVEIYRVPGNYPPTPSDASVLSGMGTVDMRGGYGLYTWFTDQPVKGRAERKGDIQSVSVQDEDLDGKPETVRAAIKGPPDGMRLPPGQAPGESDYLTTPVTFRIDPERDEVLVEAGATRAVLKEGEWSDWMPVSFSGLPGGLLELEGIVRFYPRQLRPGFEMYASPVNISPAAPAQTISTPGDFASELYDALGYYYTQGLPEEVNALKDRLFDDDDYQKQVGLVQEDSRAMLDLALSRFEPGDMTFLYVSDIDLQSHMLWRLGDPKDPKAPPHPAYEAEAAAAHGHDIDGYYEAVDRMLGDILARVPPDTTVLVMSDHGFQSQPRKANLNAWLRDHGYLVLRDGKRTGRITTGDVDWSKTRAYGLGFNSLYLNLAGREAEGIVGATEADALLAEIQAGLREWTDPDRRARVVRRSFRSRDIYTGERLAEAPDLIVGYDAGYGASDETTLGEITEAVVEDNTSRWSGNHLMDPEVVPGVVLSNRRLSESGYALPDVTATVLGHFSVPAPPGSEGRSLFTP